MQRRTKFLTLALTALLAAPTAAAYWSAQGGREPDTKYDESGFMWLEPNVEKINKVYLNVVATTPAEINPNVGATGTRIFPAGSLSFDAFFGVWRDCNKDGYIGHAESGLFEYRDEILLDKTLCPPQTPAGTISNEDAFFNQQGWVSEFRWIRSSISPSNYCGADGNGDGICDGRDARAIQDKYSMVWGDFGVPGNTMGGEFCPDIGDFPRGSTQRTGALLTHVDCYLQHRGFDALSLALGVAGAGYDAQHTASKSFDQPGHVLNVGTFGAADNNQTYATTSCAPQGRASVQTGQGRVATPDEDTGVAGFRTPYVNLTDEEGALSVQARWNRSGSNQQYEDGEVTNPVRPGYNSPGTPNADTDGSLAGTVKALDDEVRDNCDPADGGGANLYLLESDVAPEVAGAKNKVTARFTYYEEQRSGSRKLGEPFDRGLWASRSGAGVIFSGTRWYYVPAPASDPPTAPQLVRTSDFQPQGAIYWTFYANLTAEGLNKVRTASSVPGSYGDDWCSGARSGVVNGFVCDPALWWRNVDGTAMPDTEFHPRPGTLYHLRDVDCWDGTLVDGVPVGASLASISEDGSCPLV